MGKMATQYDQGNDLPAGNEFVLPVTGCAATGLQQFKINP
jgi:hypothetical protein